MQFKRYQAISSGRDNQSPFGCMPDPDTHRDCTASEQLGSQHHLEPLFGQWRVKKESFRRLNIRQVQQD